MVLGVQFMCSFRTCSFAPCRSFLSNHKQVLCSCRACSFLAHGFHANPSPTAVAGHVQPLGLFPCKPQANHKQAHPAVCSYPACSSELAASLLTISMHFASRSCAAFQACPQHLVDGKLNPYSRQDLAERDCTRPINVRMEYVTHKQGQSAGWTIECCYTCPVG